MGESCLAPISSMCEISRGNTKLLESKHVMEFSYTWTVDDLTVNIEACDVIKSPLFSTSVSSDELKWSLRLYPYDTNGDIESGEVALFLHLEPCNKSKVRAQYAFSTINSKGEKHNTMGNKESCIFEHGNGKPGYGFRKYTECHLLMENEPYGLLVRGKLTIVCEIKILNCFDDMFENSSNVTPCKVPNGQLLEDVEHLFETQQYTDFKIIVKGEEFSVHRVILSARSSVFSAMFEHNMKEHEQNHFEITDINSAVLKEMLRFIYTDKVENLEKIAEDLLVAADKYALERLKNMCEEALRTTLKIQNAADILILADVHSAYQLKKRTMEFITEHKNTSEVISTAGFTSMIASHPYLVAEILRVTAAKRSEDLQETDILPKIEKGTSKMHL